MSSSFENLQYVEQLQEKSFENLWAGSEVIAWIEEIFPNIDLKDTLDLVNNFNNIYASNFEEKWLDFRQAFESINNKLV